DSSHFIETLIRELNECLPTEHEQNCTVIGKVYYGDEFEISADEYGMHTNDSSNTDTVALKGVDFYGFDFRCIPGEPNYRAVLVCKYPPGELPGEGEEDKTYYFLPQDIIFL